MLLLVAAAAHATPAAELALPRVPDAAIVVDGRANEPAWGHALVLPDATVFEPSADVAPVGSMRTRVLADDVALYVHFDVTDPEPRLVRAGLGRRDTRNDDAVGIYLDPSGDGRRAFVLLSTPIGVQLDRLHIPGGDDDDWSWDAVWRSAGRRTATGFEVEMAIPWGSVHLSGNVESIGLLVVRHLARKDQGYAWPKVDPGTDPLLAEAHVRGPGRLPWHVGLEILPELTGAWSVPHIESGRLEVAGVGPGLTLRYNPARNFGAVATFNPDFSQLESDATQIDVNKRYALSYGEKRPFFLEGQDWFDHPMSGMVYSRSMNAPLYGARAAGEVGRVGFAALHVLDLSPPPSVSEGGGWTAEQLAGHQALATLGRVRVSLGGDSYVGLLGSDRTVLDSGLYNRVFGVDSVVRVEKRATIEAAAVGSATTLTDGAAPLLAPAAKLGAQWSGKLLDLRAAADAVAPGFRQENGFVTHADRVGGFTEDHVNLYPKVGWLPLVGLEPVDVWSYWHFDGTPRERAWDPSVWALFGNGTFVKLDQRVAGEEFGGAWIDYTNTELYVTGSIGSGVRASVGGQVGSAPYYDAAAPRAGLVTEGWAGVALQPVSAFTLSLDPEVERMTERDGTPLYIAWTGRVRAELFLDRNLWVRTIAQLTGKDTVLPSSWRVEPVVAWEWTPGRAVYVGGSYGVADVPTGTTAWQVFAKAGWDFVL
jgi:hypothetical protein